jgi:hypothetical protein
MCTGLAIKDILAIMGDKKAICRCFWSPVIDDAGANADAVNIARNTADLELLNLLHSA